MRRDSIAPSAESDRVGSGLERRQSPRYPCSANVEIGWGSEILRASLADICASGMFIKTSNPLWVRAEFMARILVPEPVDVGCVVRRVEPGCGMGVEFTELSDGARRLLDDLLCKLSAG